MTFEEARGEAVKKKREGGQQHPDGVGGGRSWAEVSEVRDHEGP